MKALKKEVTELFAEMDETTRGELLGHLLGKWCVCGGEVDEEGECCE